MTYQDLFFLQIEYLLETAHKSDFLVCVSYDIHFDFAFRPCRRSIQYSASKKATILAKTLEKNMIFFLNSPPSPLQCWLHVRLRISDGLTNVASAIFFISGGPCFEPTLFRRAGGGAGKNVARGFQECILRLISTRRNIPLAATSSSYLIGLRKSDVAQK